MPVVLLNTNNSIVTNTDNYVIHKLINQTGLLLYIKYTKGDEDYLSISQSVADKNIPNNTDFFEMVYKDVDNTLQPISSKLAATNNVVLPVALELPNTEVKISFDFVNSSTAEGTVEVYCQLNNIKYN